MVEVIEVLAKGSIVALDGLAILLVFKEARAFLKETPDIKEFMVIRKAQRDKVISERLKIWKKEGLKLYKWAPLIILFSLCIVAIVIILTRAQGGS